MDSKHNYRVCLVKLYCDSIEKQISQDKCLEQKESRVKWVSARCTLLLASYYTLFTVSAFFTISKRLHWPSLDVTLSFSLCWKWFVWKSMRCKVKSYLTFLWNNMMNWLHKGYHEPKWVGEKGGERTRGGMREDRESEREREGKEHKRKCNEQEASGMNSQRWPCMAELRWPG